MHDQLDCPTAQFVTGNGTTRLIRVLTTPVSIYPALPAHPDTTTTLRSVDLCPKISFVFQLLLALPQTIDGHQPVAVSV